MAGTASSPPENGTIRANAYAWLVFAVIALLGFSDWMVRQVVIGIFPLLQKDWSLSDGQIGQLAAIVPLVVGLTMMPLALVIDRWSRVKAMFLMSLVWSLATISCGFAATYGQMLAARGLLGLSEAAYGPAGFALLAWHFPARLRATAIGGALVASSLGNVAGIALGGTLATTWGWQTTFIAAGAISLLIAFGVLLVRDYPTRSLPKVDGLTGKVGHVAASLLGSRTTIYTCLGSAGLLFVMSSLINWLPLYLTRYHGIPVAQAAQMAGGGALLGAVGGLFWSQAADRWGMRDVRGKLYVPAIGAIAVTGLGTAGLVAADAGSFQIALILSVFLFTSVVMGPINAVVMDVVDPSLHASAGALVGLAQNLLGLAAGPLAIGYLSDRIGLERSLTVLPIIAAVSCVLFLIASRSYPLERRPDVP